MFITLFMIYTGGDEAGCINIVCWFHHAFIAATQVCHTDIRK